MSSSQLTNSYFFRGVGVPPTSNVCIIYNKYSIYYILWTSILFLMEYIITFHNSINIPYIIYFSIYNVLQKLWESNTLSHGMTPLNPPKQFAQVVFVFSAQGVRHYDMSKKKGQGKQSMGKLYETMTFSNNCKICSKHFGTKHLRSVRSMT